MEALRIKSVEFRREREDTWAELEALIAKLEKRGVKKLEPEELARLPLVYRSTLSSLSVARAISLDRNLIDYLESLCGRAYVNIYSTRRPALTALSAFFFHRFPAAVRTYSAYLLVATLLLMAGMLTAYILTLDNPERFYNFVDPAYAQDRGPHASTEELRGVLYNEGGEGSSGSLSTFASFLMTHNAKIGLLCFALGFAAGLPTMILLFLNGLILGAFAALYQTRGMGLDFWGWVLPHGVTEILAVLLCGAAGLALGRAVVFPGRSTRRVNLARTGRAVGSIALGAMILFFLAGLIEGFFRQLVNDVGWRYFVVVTTAALWIAYFGWMGRRHAT